MNIVDSERGHNAIYIQFIYNIEQYIESCRKQQSHWMNTTAMSIGPRNTIRKKTGRVLET